MKTVNSKVVLSGELHEHSLHIAYATIPVDTLKQCAQTMREDIDWRGRSQHNYELYNAMMCVIHVSEPDFKTEFIPAT